MALGKPASNDSAASEIRIRAESRCALPAGRYQLAQPAEEWRSRCELWRGVAYGYLAQQELLAGRARQALASADSAIVSMRRGNFCSPSRGYLGHAFAALALGDTATAARDFAAASAGYPASNELMMDSARVHLGARFDERAMRAEAEVARRAAGVCEGEKRMRREVRRRRVLGLDAPGR
jgi:hypothetical protein